MDQNHGDDHVQRWQGGHRRNRGGTVSRKDTREGQRQFRERRKRKAPAVLLFSAARCFYFPLILSPSERTKTSLHFSSVSTGTSIFNATESPGTRNTYDVPNFLGRLSSLFLHGRSQHSSFIFLYFCPSRILLPHLSCYCCHCCLPPRLHLCLNLFPYLLLHSVSRS